MDTTEIIGSIHGSPGDALKLLEEAVRLKEVALRDVDVTSAIRAIGRMLDEAVANASKLSYTAGQKPSVVVYDNDGGIKAYFNVEVVYDDELVVKVATNMVTDAIYAYEPAETRDEAVRQIIEVAEIYGYVKVRIPMSEALRTLCKAAAWHYSVPVLLNDIPGKLV